MRTTETKAYLKWLIGEFEKGINQREQIIQDLRNDRDRVIQTKRELNDLMKCARG